MKIIRKPLRFYELFNKLLLTVFKKLPAHILYILILQMWKLKNLKKLEKLKPYALLLNIQPKRLLAITSNDRRE